MTDCLDDCRMRNGSPMRLGIDLGASCCRAFYSIGDKSWPVYSKDGYALLPSAVEYKRDSSVIVGREAMADYESGKGSVVYLAKYLLGRQFDSDEILRLKDDWGCRVDNVDGYPAFWVEDLQKHVYPVDVCTEIIRYFVDLAKVYAVYGISGICVTVPSYFDSNQCTLLQRAVENCGYASDQVSLLQDTDGFILCYEDHSPIHKETVAVLDIGFASLTFAVYSRDGDRYSARSSHSSFSLGGNEYSKRIYSWIAEEYQKKTKRKLNEETIQIKRQAKRQADALKGSLLFGDTEVEWLTSLDGTPVVFTRHHFEEMTKDLTDGSVAFLEKCLADEGMTKSAIEYVFFAGCGARMYNLRNCVFEFFGCERIDDEFTRCDDCAAYGAYLSAMKK